MPAAALAAFGTAAACVTAYAAGGTEICCPGCVCAVSCDSAAVNWAAGTKFGPPENYFTLRSQGGPYSSIAGTRTTTAKAGSPPRPPVYQFSYDSKRSDTPAPKEAGEKKAGGRRLSQSERGKGLQSPHSLVHSKAVGAVSWLLACRLFQVWMGVSP
jgi:hypothetical protein